MKQILIIGLVTLTINLGLYATRTQDDVVNCLQQDAIKNLQETITKLTEVYKTNHNQPHSQEAIEHQITAIKHEIRFILEQCLYDAVQNDKREQPTFDDYLKKAIALSHGKEPFSGPYSSLSINQHQLDLKWKIYSCLKQGYEKKGDNFVLNKTKLENCFCPRYFSLNREKTIKMLDYAIEIHPDKTMQDLLLSFKNNEDWREIRDVFLAISAVGLTIGTASILNFIIKIMVSESHYGWGDSDDEG